MKGTFNNLFNRKESQGDGSRQTDGGNKLPSAILCGKQINGLTYNLPQRIFQTRAKMGHPALP
jgi:hypothetical protein